MVLTDAELDIVKSGGKIPPTSIVPVGVGDLQDPIARDEDEVDLEDGPMDPNVIHDEGLEPEVWRSGPKEMGVLKRAMQVIPEDVSLEKLWEVNSLLTIIYYQQFRYERLQKLYNAVVDKTNVLGINAKKVRVLAYLDVWKKSDPAFYRDLVLRVNELDKKFGSD